jgi:hypothetical protein
VPPLGQTVACLLERGYRLSLAATVESVNSRKGLPATLRVVADNLNNVVSELTKLINSVASSLEASNAQRDGSQRSKPAGKASTARKPSARGAESGSPTGPVTDETVRAAMEQLGPATSATIAAHINTAAGSTVIDGRRIRGHARRLGARVVIRRGERLYRL